MKQEVKEKKKVFSWLRDNADTIRKKELVEELAKLFDEKAK